MPGICSARLLNSFFWETLCDIFDGVDDIMYIDYIARCWYDTRSVNLGTDYTVAGPWNATMSRRGPLLEPTL